MRSFKAVCLGIGLFLGVSALSLAAPRDEYLLFGQKTDAIESVYLVKADGTELKKIAEGKKVKYYMVNGRLLYLENNRLYEYQYTTGQKIVIPKFAADEFYFYSLPGQTDETLIIAMYQGYEYWYLLDFTDYSLRKVSQPEYLPRNTARSVKNYSPDSNGNAVLSARYNGMDFHLVIQEKKQGKFKTCWTLSKTLSVFPEFPIWSPDSKKVVFYAREARNTNDFYSLYLYDFKLKKLFLIKERVFMKLEFEKLKLAQFTPSWSPDSRYLIFEYLPYGLPTESKIIRYDYETGLQKVLFEGKCDYQYPTWSPSGEKISLLSNRNNGYQLYVTDLEGENLKRLSGSGKTIWAKWLTNEVE